MECCRLIYESQLHLSDDPHRACMRWTPASAGPVRAGCREDLAHARWRVRSDTTAGSSSISGSGARVPGRGAARSCLHSPRWNAAVVAPGVPAACTGRVERVSMLWKLGPSAGYAGLPRGVRWRSSSRRSTSSRASQAASLVDAWGQQYDRRRRSDGWHACAAIFSAYGFGEQRDSRTRAQTWSEQPSANACAATSTAAS